MSQAEAWTSEGSNQAARDPEVTRALAHFVAGMTADAVTPRMAGILKDAVTDSVGCAMFGMTTLPCRVVAKHVREQGGAPQASLWGHPDRLPMEQAALANGVAIHAFDFDDHSRAKIHPGAVVLPAAFAAAEYERCDGRTLLAAVAAGYEVMNRISLAAGPNAARTKGWHLTGTTGTFAAAAAASVVFRLDPEATASAFGIAGSHSAGTWAFNAEGAMTKRLHPGLAAMGGLRAALLARRGFFGGYSVLEYEDGGFLKIASDTARPEDILRDLGTIWRAEGACFKPYACCGSNHACVDAALEMRAEYGIEPADIERIVIGVSRVVLLQTGFPYRRTTVLNAQMSVRYNVAVALTDGAALVEQFAEDRLDDPRINALIERTEVEVDPEMDAVYPARYAGIVTLHLKGAQSITRRVDYSRGMPENPMTAEEITAKFRSLTQQLEPERAADLLRATREVFDAPDVAEAIDRFRMPPWSV